MFRFLLAKFHVDSLIGRFTKTKVLTILNTLERGSQALEHVYSDALERIDHQDKVDRDLARRAISWVTLAKRQLTSKELCHAIAIEPDDKAVDPDNINDIRDVIAVCAGLITKDEMSGIVRLIHYTTQEFFERVLPKWRPDAQEDIAVACLTCVAFNAQPGGYFSDSLTVEKRLAENPMFQYSAKHWGEHLRCVESSTIASELALAFLRNNLLVDCTFEVVWGPLYRHIGNSNECPTTALHLAAQNGLTRLTQRILDDEPKDQAGLNHQDRWGRTPLYCACESGYEQIMKLLIKRGTDINIQSIFGDNALQVASRKGFKSIIELLLDNGADIHVQSRHIWSSLSAASYSGHVEVARLLLDRGADIATRDSRGRTPLHLAVIYNHQELVQLLLDRGADLTILDNNGQSPLKSAFSEGLFEIVQLILDRGSNVEALCSKGQTLLHYAASVRYVRVGYAKVVQLLLDRGFGIGATDDHGRTPLHFAASSGESEVIEVLFDRGADVNARDMFGSTPLSYASYNGQTDTCRLLFGQGADISMSDRKGMMPLHSGAAEGHFEVIQLLLDKGANIAAPDRTGWTPISYAALENHSKVVRLLLDRGADPTYSPSGWVPLQIALIRGNAEVIYELMKDGLDSNGKEEDLLRNQEWISVNDALKDLNWSSKLPQELRTVNGWSLLHWACKRAEPFVVRMLLELGFVDAQQAADNETQKWSAASIAIFHRNERVLSLLQDGTTNNSTVSNNEPTLIGEMHNHSCDGCNFVSESSSMYGHS